MIIEDSDIPSTFYIRVIAMTTPIFCSWLIVHYRTICLFTGKSTYISNLLEILKHLLQHFKKVGDILHKTLHNLYRPYERKSKLVAIGDHFSTIQGYFSIRFSHWTTSYLVTRVWSANYTPMCAVLNIILFLNGRTWRYSLWFVTSIKWLM